MQGALPESAIGKLMIDRGGALWVGGQFRGPSVTDPLGTRFRYLAGGEPRNFASGVAGNSVRAIVEDDARQWWFGTDNGELYRADAQGNALAPVEGFAEAFPEPGLLLRAMGFARGDAGKVWMATTRGLGVVDTQTSTISAVPLTRISGRAAAQRRARRRRHPVARFAIARACCTSIRAPGACAPTWPAAIRPSLRPCMR